MSNLNIPELLASNFQTPKGSRNPLGRQSPWSWAIEPVRGCNLRCGHCATRLFTGEPEFMTKKTWFALWNTIAVVSPVTRVEMANAGEPTLHPFLPEFIRMARKISPLSQIQITTNGTMLAKGELTHQELFDAGTNIIYVDMYAPKELHVKLAKESGVPFYEYYNKPEKAPGAWTYTGPDLKLIVLMDHPGNWPKKRRNLNRLGTFYNHLDWKAAEEFGLKPVTNPLWRGCTQPFRYVSVHCNGSYELCCQDFMGETAGMMGNVLDGEKGFLQFWFGRKMQDARRKLRKQCRAGIPECAKCSITFSRCDMKMWEDDQLTHWWDGARWNLLEEWTPSNWPRLAKPIMNKGFGLAQ
jgi:hypothetical protein